MTKTPSALFATTMAAGQPESVSAAGATGVTPTDCSILVTLKTGNYNMCYTGKRSAK